MGFGHRLLSTFLIFDRTASIGYEAFRLKMEQKSLHQLLLLKTFSFSAFYIAMAIYNQ